MADQSDVGAFRSGNGADAAIVGTVHVAYFKAGAVPRQPSRTKRRDAALVLQLGQRVNLVHELRKLRTHEELAHYADNRPGIDELVGHYTVDFHGAHPVFDDALHARQPDPKAILHEFAHGAHSTVAQVVNIVRYVLGNIEADNFFDH